MANETDKVVPPIPVPPVEGAPAAPKPASAAPKPPLAAPPPAASAPLVDPTPPVYGAPAYAPQPAGPAQGLSITSMVCGIAGLLFALFSFGFLPALAAVITGHLAQKRQPYAKPFWLSGLITGYLGILIGVITAIFWIVVILIAAASYARYGTLN